MAAPAPERWRLSIHLQPRASRDRIAGRHGEAVKIQVHAPAIGGAANAALIAILSRTLGVPPRAVRIVHGTTSRDKLVEIETGDLAACRQRLELAIAALVDKPQGRG